MSRPAPESPRRRVPAEPDNPQGRGFGLSSRFRRPLRTKRTEPWTSRMKKTTERCKPPLTAAQRTGKGNSRYRGYLLLRFAFAEQQIDAVDQLGTRERFGNVIVGTE